MREKNIFIGVLIVALIGVGVVFYRTYYNKEDLYRSAEPTSGIHKGDLASSPSTGTPEQDPPIPTGEPAAPVRSAATAASAKIITYDANGFSPKPLTVKVGTTVVFMNESASDMWPASAPHPTHTDYPGFDAKEPIKPGYSYSFTFTKVGTWKYHNHLNPTIFGSIVVTE